MRQFIKYFFNDNKRLTDVLVSRRVVNITITLKTVYTELIKFLLKLIQKI